MEAAPSFFTIMATGQVEGAEVSVLYADPVGVTLHTAARCKSCVVLTPVDHQLQISGCDNAYCKFEIIAGEDWQLLDGMENGITQVARQAAGKQIGKHKTCPLGTQLAIRTLLQQLGLQCMPCAVSVGFAACHRSR